MGQTLSGTNIELDKHLVGQTLSQIKIEWDKNQIVQKSNGINTEWDKHKVRHTKRQSGTNSKISDQDKIAPILS